MAGIELITRAFIRRGDRVLLAHKFGEVNTFLPGGHIEFGEYSDEALSRELREELGVEAKVKDFMGVHEYQFTHKDIHHHEVNLIYEADIKGEATSVESHLEFLWCSLDQLEEKNLLPESLPSLIREYTRTKKIFHKIQ